MKDVKLTNNKGARTSFISMYEANLADNEIDTVYQDTYVPDPYLASVLNKQGEINIEDKIYHVDSIYTFSFNEEDKGLLNQFYNLIKKSSFNLEVGKSVKLFDDKLIVFKNDVHIISGDSAGSLSSARLEGNINATDNFGSNERAYFDIWTGAYFFYSSCGATVAMQKKNVTIFLANQ